jgi:hypothetical protein
MSFIINNRVALFLMYSIWEQGTTLAPTSGELTSKVVTMASHNNQAVAPSTMNLVLPITGGSSSEPANKKQKKEEHRRVQRVGVQGPFIMSKWSHVPITFSREDL